MREDIKHIIDRLKSECRFDNMSAEKDSFYKLIVCDNECIVEIRISNHKTDLNTWAERAYKNGMYPHVRLSVVFRENDFENVTLLKQPRRKPIIVTETIYDLRQSTLDDDAISKVRDAIRNINGTKGFSDMIGTAEKPYNVVSRNPSNPDNTENNQEIKEDRNMNKKQVIRINENQLKQIVMESVKRALNEGDLLNWKQDAKNRVYVNPDGTTRPMVYTTDTLKDDLINYLQDYYDIWSLDEFRKLPKDEQKEILRKFYGDRNNGRKVKDREPKGSWINGEWWDGYIA